MGYDRTNKYFSGYDPTKTYFFVGMTVQTILFLGTRINLQKNMFAWSYPIVLHTHTPEFRSCQVLFPPIIIFFKMVYRLFITQVRFVSVLFVFFSQLLMFLTRNVSKGVVRFSELLHLPSKKYTPRFKKNIRFSIGAEAV